MPEQEPGRQQDEKGDDHDPGQRSQIGVADPGETDLAVDDGGAAGQQVSQAAQGVIEPRVTMNGGRPA
jgi:hypothetical protein